MYPKMEGWKEARKEMNDVVVYEPLDRFPLLMDMINL